jgi:hypothetical protein
MGRRMDAYVGHVLQPGSDGRVGRHGVQTHAHGFQARYQRHIERAAQVAVEAFDLALGAGAERGTSKMSSRNAGV